MKINFRYFVFVLFIIISWCKAQNDEGDFRNANINFWNIYSQNISHSIQNNKIYITWYIQNYDQQYNIDINDFNLKNWILWILSEINPKDLFMHQAWENNIKLDKKLLANIIQNNTYKQNYLLANITYEDIERIANYEYNPNYIDIKLLKIKDIYMSGQIYENWNTYIIINKWTQNIYINNSGSEYHIYSSGLMDIYIKKSEN